MSNPDLYAGLLDQIGEAIARARSGIRTDLQYIDVDLSTARTLTGTGANAPLALEIAGDAMMVDLDPTNTGNAVLRFQGRDSSVVSAPVYVQAGFVGKIPFTRILLTNDAQSGKRLRVHYGVGVEFATASSGSGVTETGYTRSLAGRSFSGYVPVGAGGAGVFGRAQLWNPAGTGKNIVVTGIMGMAVGAAGLQLDICYTGAAEATNLSANNYDSKYQPIGRVSVAQVRRGTSAGASGFFSYSLPFYAGSPPSQKWDQTSGDPFIIAPNSGLLVWANVANTAFGANFEWYEVNQ